MTVVEGMGVWPLDWFPSVTVFLNEDDTDGTGARLIQHGAR
jgi:hypothetical protein